jgi:hypothetical protein
VNTEGETSRTAGKPTTRAAAADRTRARLRIVIDAALKYAKELEGRVDGAALEEVGRIQTAASDLIAGDPADISTAANQEPGQLAADLRFVMTVLADAGWRSLSPPRLELSRESRTVTAQVIADQIAVPLVGQGGNGAAALRALVQGIEAAAARARNPKPRRRRRS